MHSVQRALSQLCSITLLCVVCDSIDHIIKGILLKSPKFSLLSENVQSFFFKSLVANIPLKIQLVLAFQDNVKQMQYCRNTYHPHVTNKAFVTQTIA